MMSCHKPATWRLGIWLIEDDKLGTYYSQLSSSSLVVKNKNNFPCLFEVPSGALSGIQNTM